MYHVHFGDPELRRCAASDDLDEFRAVELTQRRSVLDLRSASCVFLGKAPEWPAGGSGVVKRKSRNLPRPFHLASSRATPIAERW